VGLLVGVLRDLAREIVVDLVVVEGDHPGRGGVHGGQERVGAVLGMAVAVLDEGVRLVSALVAAHRGVRGPALVDVVPDEQHDVGVLVEHVGVRREVAVLPVLAGGQRDTQPPPGSLRVGSRAGAPDGRDLPAGPEPVPVRAVGAQPAHIDVDAVPEPRHRPRGAAPHDALEPLVFGDLPLHRHGAVGHSATAQRLGGEPGPQHDAVGQRVAGRHAEAEDAVGQRRFDGLRDLWQPQLGGGGGPEHRGTVGEKSASIGGVCSLHPRTPLRRESLRPDETHTPWRPHH
jgi:hypothetical protein